MNLTGLALRNLRRRPIRTALSILGIALAVGGALALLALSRSIQDATRDGMDEIGDDLAVTQKDAPDIFAGFLPADTYTVNEDGTLNSPSNAAPRGSVITIIATGGGEAAPGAEGGGGSGEAFEPSPPAPLPPAGEG